MTRPIIDMKNVVKSFGLFRALHGVDLQVKEGEIVVVISPSRKRPSSPDIAFAVDALRRLVQSGARPRAAAGVVASASAAPDRSHGRAPRGLA